MTTITKPLPFEELKVNGTYLFLINPHEIPHLVLVKDQQYFALTYKESVIGSDFQGYFNALKRTQKKMIILELQGLENAPETVFERYEQAGEKTCFVPIKETLLPQSMTQFIYELVPDLYCASKIVQAYQMNVEKELNDSGDFEMREYSLEDIYSYIEKLKREHAKRNKGISKNT